MKKFAAIFLAFTIFMSCVYAADPVEGFWISVDEKYKRDSAGWKIWEEDGILYGKILSVAYFPQEGYATGGRGKSYDNFHDGADISTFKSVGTTWIWGLKKQEEGKWADGYIIDPTDGRRYKCRITFHKADGKKYKKDTLEMRGEIGPFGRSQNWRKAVSEEEASSIR